MEKKVLDVLLVARDKGLYHAITDCGAGGLSSAVGEMAKGLGARVFLEKVPLKYQNLLPWEIWVSEAQERMVLAVPDPAAVDLAREQTSKARLPFETLVKTVMRELAKLSPQGHVHAQELYAAVNILRRVPPAPLLALLATRPEFVHVGDLHYRLEE